MKKENKQLAKERRAAERRKAALKKKISIISIIVLVILFIGGICFWAYVDTNGLPWATEEEVEETEDTTSSDTTTTTTTTTEEEEEEEEAVLNTELTRAVEEGDTVNIDFAGHIGDVYFTGGTAAGYDLTIGSGTFVDTFEEQLIGYYIGDEVSVVVTFPDSYNGTYEDENGETQSIAGKEATFEVTINGIYE